MRLCTLFLVAVLTPLTILAAEVDGRWSGTVSTPGGDFPIGFTFQGDGDTLTGTMADGYRETAIDNGTIDGHAISFSVEVDFGGGPYTLSYTGVVAGDEIALVSEGNGQRPEFVVRKME
jgi:hypothetical protein